MAATLKESNVTTFDQKDQIFGNQGVSMKKQLDGLSSKFDKLTSVVEHLSSDVNHLKYFRSDIVRMRRMILDSESDLRVATGDRRVRNALAHGGNLLADMEAIKSIETSDPERFCTWNQAFFNLYNLDFDMDNPRLQNSNTHLIDICNMMATIRLVTPWSDVSDSDPEKNLCLGLCAGLISGWRDTVETDSDEYWNQVTNKSAYDKVQEWYKRIGKIKP
ncbi:hypothetical protein V8E54_005445 [Elaphomyces granulatus]